jgi:hypothetical protein
VAGKARGGQEADYLFWRNYLDFELNRGDAERARAGAKAAMVACPRDVKLRAECVLAEAQLGDDERARAVFDSALSALAGDLEAKARLREQVRKGASSLSERRFGGCLLVLPRLLLLPTAKVVGPDMKSSLSFRISIKSK